MNKCFFIFLAFILLDFSFGYDCSSLPTATCGNHITDYKLKCQKMDSSANCVEVEVDDYCKLDSSGTCSEEDNIPENSICTNFGEANKCKRVIEGENCKFDFSLYDCKVENSDVENTKKCELDHYKKKCIFMDKTCSDYSDDTCGNLRTQSGIQCVKFSTSPNCREITVDNYCEIKNDKSCGKKVNQDWNDFKYKCELTGNKCQRRELLCEEQTDSTKCGEINQNCRAIKHPSSASSLTCKTVQLDGKCQIVNGECKDGNNIEEYEKCDFTPDYAECKPIKKQCSDCTSSCLNCQTSDTGRTCSQISSTQCQEILIHKSCEVKTDGTCSIKSQTTGKTCQFNNDNTICALVDSHCIYNSDTSTCNDNTDENNKPPEGNKCFFITINECGLIEKGCSDLQTQETCANINSQKCFWYSNSGSGSCLQYTTDEYCKVNEGSCEKKSGTDNSFGENDDCLFSRDILSGSGIVSCSKKDNCIGHWTDCSTYSTSSTYCTNGGDNCKKILLKNNCEVNNLGQCVPKDSSNINERDGICAFDDETQKNVCQLRTRKCEEYTIDTCDGTSNCVFYPSSSHCIKTDDYCTISEGNCKEKTTPNPYKKCQLEGNLCAQTEKSCNEIATNNCNNAPRKTSSQCFYFGSGTCNSISIDEYCYVDTDGKCKNLLKKLSKYEVCDFNSDKSSCKKRDKECSDYDDINCGNFTPESKLCFNFGNGCAEVDKNCQINENNECVARGSGQCTIDNNTQKCSFKNNNSSMLSTLKYALLLAYFFMF